MEQHTVFGPFFSMMALTLIVWLYMYYRRIGFLVANKIDSRELTTPNALADLTPPAVSNPSDNLKNLFEMPVLFYALVLYLYATDQVDALYLNACWAFVGFRVLHSAMHCTVNIVIVRFWLYAISTIALWFVAIRATVAHFGV